jgi:hypothetical protein
MTVNKSNSTEILSMELSHNTDTPEPAHEPMALVITLIEEEPLKMARPLSLVYGKVFGVAWILYCLSACDFQSTELCASLSVRRELRGVCLMWVWPRLTKEIPTLAEVINADQPK